MGRPELGRRGFFATLAKIAGAAAATAYLAPKAKETWWLLNTKYFHAPGYSFESDHDTGIFDDGAESKIVFKGTTLRADQYAPKYKLVQAKGVTSSEQRLIDESIARVNDEASKLLAEELFKPNPILKHLKSKQMLEPF